MRQPIFDEKNKAVLGYVDFTDVKNELDEILKKVRKKKTCLDKIMKYKLEKGGHSVYALQYHLVQVVKYRRKIFTDDRIIDFLKNCIKNISKTFNVEVLNIECDKDHFHMIFKSTPKLDIPKYINAIKTITSREIQRRFPEVKKKLWKETFWSPTYFLATTGQVVLDVLEKYVEEQGKRKK